MSRSTKDAPAKSAAATRAPGKRPAKKAPARKRTDAPAKPSDKMRIAKAMAQAGLCSRRDAERWIAEGRVKVNGKTLTSPAHDVTPADKIVVDGKPLPQREAPRLWRYHKPRGLVTTHRDPQGRDTVFDNLPADLPRVISVGRLDLNTEGLLLLTTDGELARHLELPSTGWTRRYRVRAHGTITQDKLDSLKDGCEIDGVRYGPIEATLEQQKGANCWIAMGLREGKNREVRNVLGSLGLTVNRLIRVSYGPFQLLDLKPGEAEQVKRRVIREQLGASLAKEFGLDAASVLESDRLSEAQRPRGRAKQAAETPDKAAPAKRAPRKSRPKAYTEKPPQRRRARTDRPPQSKT